MESVLPTPYTVSVYIISNQIIFYLYKTKSSLRTLSQGAFTNCTDVTTSALSPINQVKKNLKTLNREKS